MERLFAYCFQIELEFRSASFCGGRKNTEPEERPSEQGENNNKLNPLMRPSQGLESLIWMTSVGGELSY